MVYTSEKDLGQVFFSSAFSVTSLARFLVEFRIANTCFTPDDELVQATSETIILKHFNQKNELSDMCEGQIGYACQVQTRSNRMCDYFHKIKCAYFAQCALLSLSLSF